ncbi:hypothetical protein [Actinoplanes sp. NPDC049802]|uniref:hypothetical protein n=1 Tax=Actinoplanes sp. NPDC049802 TaxID=3154742 RepID=UPI003405FAA4
MGLGLPVVAAPAAPATAAPTVAAGPDLKDLLLTEDDMPKGYAAQELPGIDELFGAVLTGYDLDQELCPAPKAAAITGMPNEPSHAEPVKTKEKPKKKAESVTAAFVHEDDGVFAMEMLADTGPEIAADMVADTEEVLEECPTVEEEGVELRMSPLNWKSRLGDESAGASMVLEVTEAETELTMYGKMVVVAYGDLSLTLGLIGLREPGEKHLKKIAKAAMRKIEKSSRLSVKDRTGTGGDLRRS